MISIDCTQNFLGNSLAIPKLQQDLDQARSNHRLMEVELAQADQKKSRIYAKTASGEAIGLLKTRDWQLTNGDVFQLEHDGFLLIYLKTQPLMTLSFDTPSVEALKLIHLGHTLGNHHHPIVVTPEKIYIQLNENRDRLESAIKTFDIAGLKIDYETLSPDQTLTFASHQHG
ncbi:urease accessory protein UreE [Leptothoe kymatousa]|uniref:Urease accessory protein UreE n=1 Tax=Leptothoe kymatousa TAU-MAC 1615 TaxID=2364775 RepID=A0ABS5Y3P5_9CYAN|nr:urease accessory protein UreE [Leptothoe kymatousa]MBT9312241.1 urease accessory protein UreE [Leptothoe kymatousa TAU-MAC 1615]